MCEALQELLRLLKKFPRTRTRGRWEAPQDQGRRGWGGGSGASTWGPTGSLTGTRGRLAAAGAQRRGCTWKLLFPTRGGAFRRPPLSRRSGTPARGPRGLRARPGCAGCSPHSRGARPERHTFFLFLKSFFKIIIYFYISSLISERVDTSMLSVVARPPPAAPPGHRRSRARP